MLEILACSHHAGLPSEDTRVTDQRMTARNQYAELRLANIFVARDSSLLMLMGFD